MQRKRSRTGGWADTGDSRDEGQTTVRQDLVRSLRDKETDKLTGRERVVRVT